MSIKDKAAQTAKRAGLLSGGLLLCMVGVGFLTLAAWIFLSASFNPLEAALILAAIYLGIGLIKMGLGKKGSETPESTDTKSDPRPEMAPLMQAFVFGMKAGADAKQMRR